MALVNPEANNWARFRILGMWEPAKASATRIYGNDAPMGITLAARPRAELKERLSVRLQPSAGAD